MIAVTSESDMLKYEQYYIQRGFKVICGVDEAGRGPLAGPVCAAAVILPEGLVIEGVNDSKKLSEKKREQLFDIIREKASAYNIEWASVEEIEEMNILQATMLAMKRAVEGLPIEPDAVLVDGNRRPAFNIPCFDIVKGDSLSQSIAAASILAKVSRDRLMKELAQKYPGYGFEKHKGYSSELHRDMIKKYGPCEIHRMSFLGSILDPDAPKKKTKSQKTGKMGEDFAVSYLENNGYEITARNYRSEFGEIDIIAKNREVIAFVEVKTRNQSALDRPSAWVDRRKQKKLLQTAYVYMTETDTQLQPRFDIVEVAYNNQTNIPPQIEHIENAFGELEE